MEQNKTLYDMMMAIAQIENGLAYNEISWNYVPDKLDMALGMGHPADILDDIFCEIGNRVCLDKNATATKTELEELIKGLEAFSKGFSIMELKLVINDLSDYIASMEDD